MLGLLSVEEVKSSGLDLPIDEGSGEPSKELLGQSMVGGLAVGLDMLFVSSGSLERGSASDQLMGELSLVIGDLIVGLCFVALVVEETHCNEIVVMESCAGVMGCEMESAEIWKPLNMPQIAAINTFGQIHTRVDNDYPFFGRSSNNRSWNILHTAIAARSPPNAYGPFVWNMSHIDLPYCDKMKRDGIMIQSSLQS